MPRFRTEICIKPKDIQMILTWHNEKEYWLGRAFLATLDDFPESHRTSDPDHLEWYYIDNDQYERLLDFRKELREKRGDR
jgi:hypothetical protein